MTIQSSVQIGNIIRNAVAFNVKNWAGGKMNSELLHYYQPNVSILMSELSKYLNGSDVTQVKSVVADIQNRLDRFKDGAG